MSTSNPNLKRSVHSLTALSLSKSNSYVQSNQPDPSEEMFGAAEGKNLIVVTLESLQSFVINEEMNGQTVTPFLNELTKDDDTIYFPNFYHQTGLGKTSDSEFLLENSLYPLSGGAVFFTHSGNTYNSMAESLGRRTATTRLCSMPIRRVSGTAI